MVFCRFIIMACSRIHMIATLFLVLGLLLIACAVGILPHILKQKIQEGVKLRPGSETLKTWLDPPAPIFIDFYFFHVNNTEDFISNFTRPVVVQRGPYVYREIRNKSDYEFINAGATLRYREHKWYVFDRNLSCGDENDTFTTLNIPLVTVATKVRFMPRNVSDWLKYAIDLAGLSLFETRSVKELLWGYHIKLPEILLRILAGLGIDLTFGVYVGPTANGTDDGVYEIGTGINDISTLGQITGWRHSSALQYWSDTTCNMINGSDGTFWHPFVKKSDRLYIFNSDLCRSVYVTYSGEVSVQNITTYHFTPPVDVFEDPKINLDNRGFCTPDSTGCLRAGALNVSECRGAPIVMSEPHFYQADPFYQTAVVGIRPDPKYQTFIDIEPNIGVALKIARQVQANVFLRRLEVVSGTYGMQENDSIVFPVLWLNEHAEVNESISRKLQSEVLRSIFIFHVIGLGLLGIGAASVTVVLIVLVVQLSRSRCRPSEHRRHVQVATSNSDTLDDDARLIDAGSA